MLSHAEVRRKQPVVTMGDYRSVPELAEMDHLRHAIQPNTKSLNLG